MKTARVLFLAALFLLFAFAARAELKINEIMSSTALKTDGESYDWIELYNDSKQKLDLSGWGLSDNAKKPFKFTFPQGASVKAGGYVIVYCAGEELTSKVSGPYYADFKLSSDGEEVALTDPSGSTVQTVQFPAQYGEISYGLADNGYGFLETATPGKANTRKAYSARAEAPAILTTGGFYDEVVSVSASGGEGLTLRYTLSGETPDEKSPVFPGSIELSKTSVLRIRAFGEGLLPSETTSATYIIGDPASVAVVSLITDDKYLFDKKTGVMVKGTGSLPNYEKDVEYPVHMEYFDESGARIVSMDCGFAISGHSSRPNAQKSIALHARAAYGETAFAFNPFDERDYESYHSLLLRSTNSDSHSTRLRDAFCSSIANGMGIAYQAARPVIVYLNGEYWGHYNLREKANKYMVAQWENVTDEQAIDSIDLLEGLGSSINNYVRSGSNEDWLSLVEFCRHNDLNDADNLAYVTDRLDVDSLYTFVLFQIIIGNKDNTNARIYRVPGGKWKFMLFDEEACFMHTEETPTAFYLGKSVSSKAQSFHHAPLIALLNVPEMKEKFLARFSEMLTEYFTWTRVEPLLDFWESSVGSLLDRHIDRWGHFKRADWQQNVDAVRYSARVRPKKAIDFVAKALKLTSAQIDTYLGETRDLLEVTNARK